MSTHEFSGKDGHLTEFSSPVVHDKSLIFGSRTRGVTSLYSALRLERWHFELQNGVTSELLAANDSVFFGGGDGQFYSLNVDTGRVNWKYETRAERIVEIAALASAS